MITNYCTKSSNAITNSIFFKDVRVKNRELNLEEFKKQSIILKSRPTRAWVSFTGKCNINCAHCFRENNDVSIEPDMSLGVFDKLEKELFPFLEICKFGGNNLGEQLITKQWNYFFEQIEKYSFKRNLITNGLLLTKERITKLIRGGWIIDLSTEAATKETYQNIRGRNFDKFISTVAECCEQKKSFPETRAIIRLCFTIFYENAEELIPLIKTGAELGVDEISVTHFIPMRENQRNQSLVYHKGQTNSIFTEGIRLAQKLGISLKLPPLFPVNRMNGFNNNSKDEYSNSSMKKCHHPWTSISINEKGDVMPCCITYVTMGNLQEMTIEEIWNSRRYRKFRKTVNSSVPKEMCRNCPLRGKEFTSDHCNSDNALLSIINPINHLITGPKNQIDTLFFLRLKLKELFGKSSWGEKTLYKMRKVYKNFSF